MTNQFKRARTRHTIHRNYQHHQAANSNFRTRHRHHTSTHLAYIQPASTMRGPRTSRRRHQSSKHAIELIDQSMAAALQKKRHGEVLALHTCAPTTPMALAAALAAMLLAAHVPDVSAALSAWRLKTNDAFELNIGGVAVSVPTTKIIDPDHVPYILNFEPARTCQWHTKWPWDLTNGQADSNEEIPFCMQDIDKLCTPNGRMTECIKKTPTSCQRHAGGHAWYATITTMPMDFFLMYVTRETGNDQQLSQFDNIDVCAGTQCNPTFFAASSWVPLDVSNFEIFNSIVKSRACRLKTADDSLKYGQCITTESIRKLMTRESSEKKCTHCDWTTTSHNCVGNPAMMNSQTNEHCKDTQTAACMQNSNSISMPICQLLGGRVLSDWGFPKCINAEFMRTQGLGSIFTEGSGEFTTPTQDNHWIGLKLPTYLDDIVQIQTFFGAKHVCENDVGNKFATSLNPVVAALNQDLDVNPIDVEDMRENNKIISLDDRSIALRFKTNDWTCGPCQADQGTDEYAYTFDAPSGLARCRDCENTVEIRNSLIVDVGRRAYTKCEMCPDHQRVKNPMQTQTNKACDWCLDSTPYRLNPSTAAEVNLPETWNQCGICPYVDGQPHMFDRSSTPPACTGVPHFRLEINGNVLRVGLEASGTGSTAEYYQKSNDVLDWTTNGFDVLPLGGFLNVSQTNGATHLTKADCDGSDNACAVFQYRALCGHLYGGTDMYVKKQTNPQLLLASDALATDITSYSIAREGQCTDCTPSSSGYYNGACSSAGNSPGSATLCQTFEGSRCNANQYLYHESQQGCNQTQARTDYECRNCPLLWTKNNSKYQIFIVVGCGVAATSFTRWDTEARAEMDGVIRPVKHECMYADPLVPSKCLHRANPHALRDPLTQRFWSSAGEEPGTALLPYCPEGWFVDTKSNDAQCSPENLPKATEYTPQCCKQCQASIPGFMKATDYEDCPGSSTEDLQKWVTACPAGQYKLDATDAGAGSGVGSSAGSGVGSSAGSGTDIDTDTGDGECKPCTVCGS